MEIRIDLHTLERAEERGTNEEEIKDVINAGIPIPAKRGRLGKAKIYDFEQKRHDSYYEQKRVEVIYTQEREIAVTVSLRVLWKMGEPECRFCMM